MTTSGNISWELNRDQMITRAYAKLGIPGDDNTLTTTQISNGAEALNTTIALAVTDGMPLWKRTIIEETLSTTSQIYTLTDAMKVSAVYLRDVNGVQYALQEKSLYDFMQMPRYSSGIPVCWTWQTLIQGGTISLWPLTSDSSTVANKHIEIVYQKEFDGFFNSTDTLDMPAYWIPAIVYRTAVLLAPEQGYPLQDRQILTAEAQQYWTAATGYGDEDGSIFVTPEKRFQ